MSYVENILTGFPKMKELLSILARSFSSSVPSFGAAGACFFAKRFFSTVSYYPPTSPFAHPIPKLPIIDSMVEKAAKLQLPALDRTAIISVQHLLETTATLFKGLIDIGLKPENIFLAGKPYSTSSPVFTAISDLGISLIPTVYPKSIGQYQSAAYESSTALWQRFVEATEARSFDKIIILDEGGGLLKTMPSSFKIDSDRSIVGIEQTRGGLYEPIMDYLSFPLIEVASSAVKRIIEPQLIAGAILSRAKPIIQQLKVGKKNILFGVVGNGAIGSAIINYLLSEGFKVACYDENDLSFQNNKFHINAKNLYRGRSASFVITTADVIFGCTGRDITQAIDIFKLASTNKTFISCTSGDEEFHSLLDKIASVSRIHFDPLGDISYATRYGGTISILSGGFPFNFDRTPWSVPSHDIEITRGLLFGACLQALRCTEKPVGGGLTMNGGKRYCLNPYIQKYVTTLWSAKQPAGKYPPYFFSHFSNVGTIVRKSGGTYQSDLLLEQTFSDIPRVHKKEENLPQPPQLK